MATGTRNKKGKTSITHPCATCSQNVVSNAVQCDRCQLWVHIAQQCSGLPTKLAREFLNYNGDCLSYVCISCQTKPSSDLNTDLKKTMDQLFRTVQGISSVVSNLTGRLDNLTDRLDNQSQSQLPTRDRNQTNPSQTDIKDLIRKEITEMHEREKRKHNIIIRGINYSQDDFQTNFNLITNNIINRNVRLTNIKPLKPNIVRADIDDADLRKQLLLNASKLKSNQLYAHIFISRDLTYNQRTQLRERRLVRVAMTGANAVPVSSSLSPTSTNSHSGLDLHTTVAPTALTPSSPSPSLTLNTATVNSPHTPLFRSTVALPNVRSPHVPPNDP